MPNGVTIYFHSNNGIWATGATGRTPERISERATRGAVHRDGKTFAFVRDSKVWTSMRGGEPHEKLLYPKETASGGGFPAMVGFSPDGAKLAVILQGDLWILAYPEGAVKKAGSFSPDSRSVSNQDKGAEAKPSAPKLTVLTH
jgi:hypothetical protein